MHYVLHVGLSDVGEHKEQIGQMTGKNNIADYNRDAHYA